MMLTSTYTLVGQYDGLTGAYKQCFSNTSFN